MDKNLIWNQKFTLEKIHAVEINSLNWSPDSKKLVTASSDKLIKVRKELFEVFERGRFIMLQTDTS